MTKTISERQTAILAIVKIDGFVATEQLVEQFAVTPQTIRRDINILCQLNLLQRFHGGAGRVTSIANESYDARLRTFVEAKHDIAAHVAAHIPDGSSLFLHSGTTTEMVAQALLHHKYLKIVTNNLHVASILTQNQNFEVMITGGQLRNRDGGVFGPETTSFINKFRLDYGIIGVSGIDEDGSLLDYDFQETRNADAIITNSHEIILVADHSKFGRRAMTKFGHLSQIDWIFTDKFPDDAFMKIINGSNVSLKICEN